MILWITGVSGSGKTTLAGEVVRRVREAGMKNVLAVDGDVMREVWGGDLGYSEADRRANMARIARLCRYIEGEGCHAVASVVAPYRETREWMRANAASYYEVFIACPLENLAARDPKGLYRRAMAGETELPGVNQPYETPLSPDLVIDNAGTRDALLTNAHALAGLVLEKGK